MRRRRLLVSVGLVLGFLALVLVGLVAAVKREPGFYTQAELPAGPERTALSQQAVAQYFGISLDEPNWEVVFSSEQVNAFFQEDYYKFGGDDNWPEGVSAPRVKMEDGKMRFGFRYGRGLTSTVVSLEIRLWKVAVPDEPNTVAMEIVSFRAGSLPLSTGNLLDLISQLARREKIDIAWYRQDGHPVAVMRFQSDLSRPTFQFDRIELKDGKAIITGRSTDPAGAPVPPRVVGKP